MPPSQDRSAILEEPWVATGGGILRFKLAFFAALNFAPMHARNWNVATTLHPGGDGGYDEVTVDAPNHRLFVTRATRTR